MKTRTKAARAAAEQARLDRDYALGIYTDEAGHQHAPCGLCGCDCSTHPDAAHPLAHCGDCGAATCDEHRDQNDPASRCTSCAARFHNNR